MRATILVLAMALLVGCGDADVPAVWPGPGVAPSVDAGAPDSGLGCGAMCSSACGPDDACVRACLAEHCGGG